MSACPTPRSLAHPEQSCNFFMAGPFVGSPVAMSKDSSPSEQVPASSDPSVPSTGDARKHHLLGYLGQFVYPVELGTLAAHVVASERSIALESVSDDERARVAIQLHHVHIPVLVERGVIEYDPDSRMAVTATPDPDPAVEGGRSSWSNEA
jgi:hypothetical protein